MDIKHGGIKKMNFKKNILSILIGVSTGMLGSANAETLPIEDTAVSETAIERIMVTATKRAGTLQSAPVTINAFTGESLEKGGLESTWDLQASTPGLLVGGNVRAGQLYMRGIGSDSIGTAADGSSTVHIDGVYLARPEALLSDFIDVDRIEVLKGPQGTLYGRNSVGGTVNLISKAPTDEFSADAGIELGNYNKIRTTLTVNGGLSENVSGRFSMLKSTRDGYVENIESTGHESFDNEDMFSVRGSLLFLLGENADFTLNADYSEYDDNGVVNVPIDLNPLLEGRGGVVYDDPFKTASNTNTYELRKYWGISGKYNYAFEDMDFLSLTAYRDTYQDTYFNTSAQSFNHARFTPTTDHNQFTQEFQLSSSTGNDFEWLVGLYYFKEEGFYNPQVLFNFADRPGDNENAPSWYGDFFSYDDTTAYAAFFNGSYAISDRVNITAGLRYSNEDKDHSFKLIDITAGAGDDPGLTKQTGSWSALTPKVGVDFQINDDNFLYASYSEGFKSGGFDAFSGGDSVEPETVNAFEIGSKNMLFNDSLMINLAAFYYDYKDLQVNSFHPVLIAIRSNAASATVQGLEMDITARPTKQLSIDFGLALLDATYDDFISPPNAATASPAEIEAGFVQLKGNSLRNAPEVSFSASIEYTIPLSNSGEISLRLDGSYQSEVFYTQYNTPGNNQEAYGLANARIGYTAPNDQWELSAFVQNIADKHYWSSAVEFGNIGLMGANGNPRTFGVKLKYNF